MYPCLEVVLPSRAIVAKAINLRAAFHHAAFGAYEAHVAVERTGGSQLEVGSDRDTALIGFVHQCPFQKVGIVKMIHNLECICIYEKSLYRLPFICFFLLFAMRQR